MSLLDRNKRTPAQRSQEREHAGVSVGANVSNTPRPAEVAGAPSAVDTAVRPSRRPGQFKQPARTTVQARNTHSRRLGRLLRTVLGCLVLAVGIGSTGSFAVATLAFMLTGASALMVVLDRPPRLRAFYAGAPGTALLFHAAAVVGALAAWGSEQYPMMQRLHLAPEPQAAAPESEAPPDAAGQMRALETAARAAVQAKDWQQVAALLSQAVVLQKNARQDASRLLVDGELLQQLEKLASEAAEQQRIEKETRVHAEIRALLAKAEAAKAQKNWSEATAAVAAAVAAHQAYEDTKPKRPLDHGLLDEATALTEEIGDRQAAERSAPEQADQLQQAFDRGEQLVRAKRWGEADRVFKALSDAVDTLSPDVRAAWPAGFSLAEFQERVKRRVVQIRTKSQ